MEGDWSLSLSCDIPDIVQGENNTQITSTDDKHKTIIKHNKEKNAYSSLIISPDFMQPI